MRNVDIIAAAAADMVKNGVIKNGCIIDTFDGWTFRGYHVKRGQKAAGFTRLWCNFSGRCVLVKTALFSEYQVEKNGNSATVNDEPATTVNDEPKKAPRVSSVELSRSTSCKFVKNTTGYNVFVECDGCFYCFPVHVTKNGKKYSVYDGDTLTEYTTGTNKNIIDFFVGRFKCMSTDEFLRFYNSRFSIVAA